MKSPTGGGGAPFLSSQKHATDLDIFNPYLGAVGTVPQRVTFCFSTSTKQIQALVLYSNQALDMIGVSDVQMESLVSASIAEVNVGFANSLIGINLTVVHQTVVSTYCAGSI